MKSNVDLLHGDITKSIIKYALPIFLANCFSELYNITNSLIVGNFISTKALSAVSACTWICNIFNYTFYGLGLGAGILVANLYGANKKDKLKQAMDTSIVFGVCGGIVLTIISETFLPLLMRACNIAPDIYNDALQYLRVYLLGNTCVLTYQMCFFIMRSFGDSKHPLYYLILSSIINMSLGVIFVRVLHMSVVGTALATIISQLVVDILSLRLLFNYDGLKFDIHNIDFSLETVGRICELGLPAGIQNMLIAISSMLVQSYVNLFPNEVIAGIGVAEKSAVWGQMPSLALSSASTSFISQNYGAKQYDRLKQGIRKILIISTISTSIMVAAVIIMAPNIVALFNDNPEVIYHGSRMCRIIAVSFLSLNLSHIYNGACRATGNVRAPMLIAVASQVICKYLFVLIGLKINFCVEVLYCASAVGYGFAGIFATIYFHTSNKVKESNLR